ncbi:hypothetical protein Acr_00g0093360 [Actinidia rufa]|uniref:Uncharacterized protein n=1 Tax=Actinidia rufa TaxID=165716 RepID=A0A7J0DXV3_9ERIC|nr:hypothetical protein Acr_00g0093360 [Actinidia rufa]
MHLRSCLLPRPSASNTMDNRSHTMAGNNQAPNLEGLHREMHEIAKQIRIMNENKARLIQHLATNNPPPPATPIPAEIEWSLYSRRLGDHEFGVVKALVGPEIANPDCQAYDLGEK